MPKVSNLKLSIDGKPTTLDVYYNASDKFHFKYFPTEVYNLGSQDGETKILLRKIETENDLRDTAIKIIDNYHKTKSKSRKVIAYWISAVTPYHMVKIGAGHYQGNKSIGMDSHKITSISGDAGFTITWKMYLEVDENGKNYYCYDEDGAVRWKTSVDSKAQILEWTPERESMFEYVSTRLEELFLSLIKVMGNPEKLIEMSEAQFKQLMSKN